MLAPPQLPLGEKIGTASDLCDNLTASTFRDRDGRPRHG